MKSKEDPIVVQAVFYSSINRVWNALTIVEEMKLWFFDNIKSFRAEVGFETQFEVRVDERLFTHLWKVTEVIPNQKITYNWKYEEYPGDSYLTFELSEEKKMVKLKVLHQVVESFPADISEFSRESGIAGWNYFIKKSLKEYLEEQ